MARWLSKNNSNKKEKKKKSFDPLILLGIEECTRSERGSKQQSHLIIKQLILVPMIHTPKEAAAAYDRAVIKHNLSKDKLNRPDGYPKIKTTKKKKSTLISTNTTGYRGVS